MCLYYWIKHIYIRYKGRKKVSQFRISRFSILRCANILSVGCMEYVFSLICFGLFLWQINLCRLFDSKSGLYMYSIYIYMIYKHMPTKFNGSKYSYPILIIFKHLIFWTPSGTTTLDLHRLGSNGKKLALHSSWALEQEPFNLMQVLSHI